MLYLSFPFRLVGLQLSSISGEPPLAMKYHLHPLTATPVSSTKEEAWSELVEDIFVDLHLTNDGWGYLTKGLVNDDGTLHLFNEGLDVSYKYTSCTCMCTYTMYMYVYTYVHYSLALPNLTSSIIPHLIYHTSLIY